MGESFFPQAQIKLRSSRTKTEILEKLLWLFEVGHVCHTQYEERRKLKDTNEDQRCERGDKGRRKRTMIAQSRCRRSFSWCGRYKLQRLQPQRLR